MPKLGPEYKGKVPDKYLSKEKENENFSKRFRYDIKEKEITIREDAPIGLREFVIQTVYSFGYKPSFLRNIVCQVLKAAPDRNNWSEYPNIDGEVFNLIDSCDWFLVYDIIESFSKTIDLEYREKFQSEINDYFKINGIGWKLENGIVEIRGDETFEKTIHSIVPILEEARLKTAKSEIEEAIKDLSRKPKPDITGAIQHSIASLECVCREVSGNENDTLGNIMKKNSTIIPSPLDQAISKIWGYTSEQGRHLKEGLVPEFIEAELIVELTATISTYLVKKLNTKR